MRKMNMAALAAVATVLASPFRALMPKPEPLLTLKVPTVPAMPRAIVGGLVRADVSGDPKLMITQLNAAFEEFKKTHDERSAARSTVSSM